MGNTIDRNSFALAALALLCCAAFSAEANAQERPRSRNLVLAGMAMGVPTYALGVAMHEGSHALAGTLLGANVTDYSLIPGFHPRTGRFYFGYVTVRGLRSDRQRILFLAAPKLTDSLMLGGYAALYASDSLPSNAWATTAVLVLATGFWVDFSKDILSFKDNNDTIKIYKMIGLRSELTRFPARLLHAGLSVLLGYGIYRGYRDLFARSTTAVVGSQRGALLFPMWDARF